MTDKKRLFNYELNKTKKIFFILALSTILLQLIFFIFFSLIGKFESDGDDLLRNFQTIHSLSSTITMSTIALIASIIIRPIVAKPYMKNSITRTFLYPVKRSDLFLAKFFSCSVMIFCASFLGFCISLIFQIVIGILIKVNNIPLNQGIFISFMDIVSSCMLVLVVVCVTQLIGIKYQSEVAIIVAATVGIVLLGNVSAMGLINYSFITMIFSLGTLGATGLGIQFMKNKIHQMELR